MGFPIKKRMNSPVNDSDGKPTPPSGLDLLSAAITTSSQSPQQPVTSTGPSRTVSEGSIETHSSSTESKQEVVDQAVNNTINKSHKRAKTFPEILMDILTNPEYNSIVSWLPDGKSFAVHNPNDFSSVILPKYFRRVIFRSFIRKLNRWGFRSVKRSVSGFESTFEHKDFRRDEPELITKMYCKSNPSAKAAMAEAGPRVTTKTSTSKASPAVHSMNDAVVTPSASSASSLASATLAVSAAAAANHNEVPQVPSVSYPIGHTDVATQLRTELILRELQLHQRQQSIMNLVHQPMPVLSDADILAQYIAERRQQLLMSMQYPEADGYEYARRGY